MPNDRLNGCSGWGAPQDVTKLSKSLHANKQAHLVPNDWNVGRLLPFQKSSQTHSCGINNAVQIKQVGEGPGTRSPGLADSETVHSTPPHWLTSMLHSASTEVWKWYDHLKRIEAQLDLASTPPACPAHSACTALPAPPTLRGSGAVLAILLVSICCILRILTILLIFLKWAALIERGCPCNESNELSKGIETGRKISKLYMPPHHHNRLLLHQLLPGINSGEPKSHYKRSQDPDSITWQIVID